MTTSSYLYWNYYVPKPKDNCLYAWFEKSPYKQTFLYCYIKKNISIETIIPFDLFDYVYKINNEEEDQILSDMTIKGKLGYFNRLNELGFEDYSLYAISLSDETLKHLRFLRKEKEMKTRKFSSQCNRDQETIYIVLRSDLGKSIGEQMTHVAEAASVWSKWSEKDLCDIDYNIIIVQATADDLFIKNTIPLQYDDPKLFMDMVVSYDKRVAHGNFITTQPEITSLVYYSKKMFIPKWVRRLPLYKGS